VKDKELVLVRLVSWQADEILFLTFALLPLKNRVIELVMLVQALLTWGILTDIDHLLIDDTSATLFQW